MLQTSSKFSSYLIYRLREVKRLSGLGNYFVQGKRTEEFDAIAHSAMMDGKTTHVYINLSKKTVGRLILLLFS